MQKTVAITVAGIVQGVYYRQSTKAQATEAGITGEIKNNTDGTVGIIATGEEDKLEAFIAWCNQGPETAVVSTVKVKDLELQNFNAFRIVK